MNVLLIDEDDDYRRRFGSYLAENLSGIVLTLAPDEGKKETGPGLWENTDLVLTDENERILQEVKREGLAEKTVILASGEDTGPRVRSDGIRCVFKYQRASSIVSSVAELADMAVAAPETLFQGRMEVIAVTGFPGGCGRTSFCLMYARLLRRSLGKSPVILAVEKTGNLNDYFIQSRVKSDLNLMLLNFTSGFRVAPQRFIAEDDYGVSAFVMPEQTSCDITDLSSEETGKLINMIGDWGFFDTLILDLHPQAGNVSRSFLKAADRVFVLHDHRRGIRRSEQCWLENLSSICGTVLIHIMNMVSSDRMSGEIFVEEKYEKDETVDPVCHIPYDSGSFFIKDGTADLSMSGGFARSVAGVAERM